MALGTIGIHTRSCKRSPNPLRRLGSPLVEEEQRSESACRFRHGKGAKNEDELYG